MTKLREHSLPSMPEAPPLLLFLHVAAIPGTNWSPILQELIDALASSGLRERFANLFFGLVGGGATPEEISSRIAPNGHGKVTCIHNSQAANEYEWATLQTIRHQSAAYGDCRILYMHTKGVSRPGNKHVADWRRLMTYWLVDRFSDCMLILDEGYDAVGSLLCNSGTPARKIQGETHMWHYSGNFWWTTGTHVARLPDIPHDESTRNKFGKYWHWLNERWLLQPFPDIKVAEIYRDPAGTHFYDHSPAPLAEMAHSAISPIRNLRVLGGGNPSVREVARGIQA